MDRGILFFLKSSRNRKIVMSKISPNSVSLAGEFAVLSQLALRGYTKMRVRWSTHLNKVARQLNERPRETLGFETPAERFNACVASTG
jgi:hypothetical protein